MNHYLNQQEHEIEVISLPRPRRPYIMKDDEDSIAIPSQKSANRQQPKTKGRKRKHKKKTCSSLTRYNSDFNVTANKESSPLPLKKQQEWPNLNTESEPEICHFDEDMFQVEKTSILMAVDNQTIMDRTNSKGDTNMYDSTRNLNVDSELEMIKLFNMRKFSVATCIIWFLADVSSLYPRFHLKKFFPNQIGMIMEAIFWYPICILLLLSYCKRFKNKARLIKTAQVLLIVRGQFGFWNLPDDEVGKNAKIRFAAKAVG